ncbi:unnamed protein product [Trichobilharzia regenti]|nr:unnamed protein product [Trichobilharzia regenti]
MYINYIKGLLQTLNPLQTAVVISYILNNSLGLFECYVISRNKYASQNTLLYYLTCALIALTKCMHEIYSPKYPACFIYLFTYLFISNCLYLLVCMMYSREKNNTWVCITFLTFICTIYYCIHKDILLVSNKQEVMHTILFLSSIVNSFIPFDALLSIMISGRGDCPPQWIPLLTGIVQSLFTGLLDYTLNDTLMAPADALGIAVHLFGLIVEIQCQFMRR